MAGARPGRRLSAVLAAYLALTALLGWRLVSVQVVSAAEYRSLAARQTHVDIPLPAQRGRLYDREGEPLAMTLAAATVYANPRVIPSADRAGIAAALAPLLERDAGDIAAELESDASFVYLARQLPRKVGEQITAMKLPGVGVLEEPKRTYPAGSLAAQVIGFVGVDNTGLSGLEAQYEEALDGEAGRLQLERAPGGLEISAAPRQVEPAVPGEDLVLTLDRQIQSVAERALADAVKEYKAKGGSAIVMDAETGEVLAMASVPLVDPANIGASGAYARRNRAVTDVYEPGSVNKAITAAAALEEGIVSADDIFTVPGEMTVGGKTFGESHDTATRKLAFSQIIAQSSNIGTIMVAQRLGPDTLYEYLRRFGYGEPSGLDFPAESGGLLPAPETWWATSLPTIAIGQGVSATLLQVAEVYETIARGGEWVQPTLVRGTVGPEGRLEPAPASARHRVVSAETATTISDMLVGVVESEHGTGSLAAVPGYHVGGKTGTAQKPSPNSRGYQPGAYIASFAGFAPAEDPALVTAVMLDEPEPIYGGLTAAPVFSEIMGFALNHRRVPPSDPAARAPVVPTAPPTEGDEA